jgi:hypothetical protein
MPIRCIISIGVDDETTVADPLLPVSDIELMFIVKASIQSAGESPIFTCTTVLAVGVGVGVGVGFEVPVPPPHPLRVSTPNNPTQAIVTTGALQRVKRN